MTERYSQLSGFAPENESDIMLRLRVLAGELYKERAYAEYIMRQMFPTTAEGTYLEAHAAQRNLTRKAGTKASGRVIFSTNSEEHGDITIPAGTVVCTTGSMKRYVTDEDAVIMQHTQTVNTAVTAVDIGSEYNVGAHSIEIIVTPVLGVDSVTNSTLIVGGTDNESDEQLRERIKDSYANISNGTNAAYYRSAAMSFEGVYSASAIGRVRGQGTVDVYVYGRDAAVPLAKRTEIETALREARELNVDVRVFNPSKINISLYIRLKVADGYEFNTVANEVQTAVTDYINSLGIGGDVLLSKVGDVIYHIKGVEDYRFLESYGSDRILTDSQVPSAFSIQVRSS